MSRSDLKVTARESRRVTTTAGRKIGSGVPEGLVGERPHCGAVAGTSAHAPMT